MSFLPARKPTRECVYEGEVDGVPVRVWTIHGTGCYQPEWVPNPAFPGLWRLGFGGPTVAAAMGEVRAWAMERTLND
jgi:hypothetical protein